jgi:hypothetical protein
MTAAVDEMCAWDVTELRPKLARAARGSAVLSRQALELERQMTTLLGPLRVPDEPVGAASDSPRVWASQDDLREQPGGLAA